MMREMTEKHPCQSGSTSALDCGRCPVSPKHKEVFQGGIFFRPVQSVRPK